MGDLSKNNKTLIMHLPDDCLTVIFHGLDSRTDRESFGLTCRRWLGIHDFNHRTLKFLCSLDFFTPFSLPKEGPDVDTLQLHKLLRRFQHLESLCLSGCKEINDAGLTRLLNYGSDLQKLNLDLCLKVTDYGLSLVAFGCPLLTSISLYRCPGITDSGLETLANACFLLKYVNLSYCMQISDNGLKALSHSCRQLEGVNISHCEGITGVGFSGCSNTLAYIEAECCMLKPDGVSRMVSGGGLEYLNVSCLSWSPLGDPLTGIGSSSSIMILNFRMCRTVSDTSIAVIAKGCPLLEEWNLALCHEVSIFGWQAVGLYCKNLKTLHVNRCRNLCNGSLQALREGCNSLTTLHLSNCIRLSPAAVELFKFHRAEVCVKEEELVSIKPPFLKFR